MLLTDKLDYSPGDTAILSGSGFQPGETVDLQVLHTDGLPNTGADNLPWTVQADSTGAFSANWYVGMDNVGSSLEATANGETSLDSAFVDFTDRLTGAIFTTNSNGSQVNGNIYTSRSAVYLDGGPDNGGSSLPNGSYYFQVTDPSGSTLLSTDDISQREFTVTNGVISYSGSHQTGTDVAGGVVIQLMPYNFSANGEYKVWATPVSSYDPTKGKFGFLDSASKTDNFKVLATPQIATTASAGGTVGIAIHDTATVSEGNNPTGTVTFNLYTNSSASGTPVFTDTESLSGAVATSANYATTQATTYYWVATYNGDSNNNSVSSGAADEPVTITQATPAIRTSQSAGGTVGISISDTAFVTGGFAATGTVTFNLYTNNTASGTPIFTDTENLSGSSATSSSYATTQATTYYWVATYNGDFNNMSITSGPADEPVTTSQATPQIQTEASAGGTVGVAISDTAAVSAGYNATGTVTFKLYTNANATGNPIFDDDNEALVNGLASSASYMTTAATTYYWVATYNGDLNNVSVTSGPADELVTTTKASPTIVTTSNQTGTVNVGAADITVGDTAVVSGGYNESGNLVFTLHFATSTGSSVAGTPISVTLHGDDTYSVSTSLSASSQVGTYVWTVTYAGDDNNHSAQDQGGSNEQFTIRNVIPPGGSANQEFWGFASGRALVESSQWGGATGKALGNWLSSNWPNLFGNLAGATNHQVVNYYHLLLMKNTGTNVNAATARAALSAALSIYATTTGLGWGTASQADGFVQGFGGVGLGSEMYNVGTYGASFGVPNNTYLTVNQIMTYLDGQTTVLTSGSPTTLRTWKMYGGNQILLRGAKFVEFDIARLGWVL